MSFYQRIGFASRNSTVNCRQHLASIATTMLALFLLAMWSGEALSYPGGITGRTLRDGGAGCGSCHSPNKTLGVSIGGPTTLAAGVQGSFTVNISGGTNGAKMGVDIAASGGTLSESSSYLQVSGDEVIHNNTADNNADTSGDGTFNFKFTMPGGAAVGAQYIIYAAARNGNEWNNAGNYTVTVPKLNQTITFNAQTSPRTYSTGATFSISPQASASSGLSITYTSDTPSVCTTPGTTSTTVTMQGAGTCTIRANQNGNSTYNAATDVTRSITINKGNQTVTFGSQAATPAFSNGGTFNLSPAASASSGLAITYSSTTPSVCTKAASGIVVTMVSVGTCTIQAAQPGNTDWNAAGSVSRSITIIKGNQTITFPAQSNKAFVANATFSLTSVTASSGLALTYASLTPDICTVAVSTTNSITMVDNGTCTIEVSQNGNSNFNPAADVSGDILLTETPLQPLMSTRYAGDQRATITFGANGNGPSTTYTATCTAAGQTTRTGSSTTVYSPIVVLSLVNGVSYSCTITASNAFGTSPPSSAGTVTPSASLVAPAIRSGVPPAALYTFNVGVAKTFKVVSTGTPDALVTISGSLPSGMTFNNSSNSSKFITGLGYLGGTPAAGTVGAYAVTFTATNTGCGGALEPVCPTQNFTINIAKGSPVINFPVPADSEYSPTPFALTASITTTNSTLATTNIVFTGSTPSICSVTSGGNVTMLSTGTCTINANSTTAASYTASYNAATQVSRSFIISKAAQTITFGTAMVPVRTYSAGLSYTLAPLATASSGLAVSYASVTPSVCDIVGTTVTVQAAGLCTIEASQDGNALYQPATDAQQSTTISQAAQTITFPVQGAQSYVQNGSFAINPLATSTSGLTVDYASTTPGVCMAAGTNVTIVTVGTCSITASQTGDQNYAAATSVNRNIAINAVAPGAPVVNDTFGSDATARLFFDTPTNTGGAPITGYRGTCNPGNITTPISANSPVVVTGLTNNTLYTCTVAAQNAAGTSVESNSLTVTPILRSGTVLWNAVCTACHSSPPSAARFNAAGNTSTVLQYVRANQPLMQAEPSVQALTSNELAAIAQYIQAQLTPITANTPYVTPVNIDVGPPLHIYLGGVAFTDVEVVAPPTKGNLSLFTGTVATYTPGVGFDGADSFTYRGKRTSPSTLLGEARTVSITIGTPAAPVITSAATANGVFGAPISYQITATNSPGSFGAAGLGAGVSVNPATGLISGTPTAAGVFNVTVSATNPGGTGMQSVQVTISQASQTITFGAQASPQPFGANFAVSPLATSTSGLTATYSSLTPSVCTVAGTTVTPVSAGTCTIAADQSGNTNYNAALQVTRNVTINAIAPGAPTGLMAVAGVGQASLSFAAPANTGGSPITQYNASCSPSGTGSNIVSPITVSSLMNGTQYTCSVTATNGAALTGPASTTVMVTPTAALVAPSITSANATTFTVLSAGNFTVTATGNLPPVLSLVGTLPSGVTFTPATGALAGTPATGTANAYPVTISATNASGAVMQSFTLTVAKANQTITFANPGTKSFSPTPFAITPAPSASSGLAVVLTSNTTGVCTVSGSNVTTVTTGVCSISANVGATADYNAATTVTNAFSINAASQSITFGAQTSPRSFSNTPFALNPVASSNSGLAVVYSTTTPSVCTLSGTNVNTLTAGVCTIAANQAGNANYAAATQVTQSVTINAIAPGAPTIGIASGSDQQAMVNFTAPANGGGASLSYTATCTASGQTTRTGNSATSPIAVSNMVNGIAYTCSVTATNSAGTGPSSGTVMVTPTSADGAALWASVCDACHTTTPSGNQLNGAGSTATVINYVRSTQTLMAGYGPVQSLNDAEIAAIAAYIGNNLVPNEVTTAFNTPAPIDVSGHITFTGQSWSAFTSVEVVTPPTNGMLSTFTGTSATYTPNPGFSGIDTFTYRGKRSSPGLVGDPVQVTVTVMAGAPIISSAGTANGTFGQAFGYQITASGSPTGFGASGLPAGVTVDTLTGAISGTANAAGTFNATVSASNAGGTGMAALVITIAKATQTITFNVQSPPTQSFVPGGSFAINPAAGGGASGNPIVYSSTTPAVCSVTSSVTMLTAGTCTIAANQAGNANYLAAPQVTQSVAITAVVPGAPGIGSATPGNTQAQIGFTAPSQNGGSAILDYTATCTSAQPTRTGTGTSSPLLVTGMVNGVTYNCTVTARNGAGNSAASSAVQVTPAVISPPDAPNIGLATAGDGSASIAFSPPANNGGAAISQYTATCNPGSKTGPPGATSPITVAALTNGLTYTCSVTATNSAGTGPASATVDVTPLATALVAVQSRKTHGGGAGDHEVQIVDPLEPITGNVTVEPRVIGSGHRIVFQFDSTVGSVASVSATNTLGQLIGSATSTFAANEVIVTLTGIPDNSRVKVTVTGVNGAVNASAAIGFLVGDVNSTRSVNAVDISAVKARAGSDVSSSIVANYLFDLDLSGTVNNADSAAAKARSGLVLP